MSQRTVPSLLPSVRAWPRWSAAGQRPPWPFRGRAGLPASIAADPASSAIVGVGPPLAASRPSFGSASTRSLVPAESPQPAPGKIKLNPCEVKVEVGISLLQLLELPELEVLLATI